MSRKLLLILAGVVLFPVAYESPRLRSAVWEAAVRLEMLRDSDADDYVRRVHALHRLLGIPDSVRLPLQREARSLVAVPAGPQGEMRMMAPETARQWKLIQEAAARDGVTLAVRWAYRSVDDQVQLIRRQLNSGARMDELMTWMAAPGYSEHHTGKAIDIDFTDGTDFEKTPAFHWLLRNAESFNFRRTYKPDNPYGIMPEPWHWVCEDQAVRNLVTP